MDIDQRINLIEPIDKMLYNKAMLKWNSIAKPLGAMGVFEEYIATISAINGLNIDKKCVAVMCADNGIVSEGVTQTGSEVTAIVAENMVNGMSSVTIMAKVAGVDVFPYDVGMISNAKGVVVKKNKCGTNNFAHGPAMSYEDAIFAIKTGIDIVYELKNKGYNIIATGEMGIGNTTTSSAITAVLCDVDASIVTGKGAGLSCSGIAHKAKVINSAIAALRPDKTCPIDLISKVGGFDIAALCGVFLGGGIYKVPIIIDGFISSVSALLATLICPNVRDYMLPSHLSGENAGGLVLDMLNLTPPLDCHMALGEGTGAVALMPLLDMAAAVFQNMPTFSEISVEEYKPL